MIQMTGRDISRSWRGGNAQAPNFPAPAVIASLWRDPPCGPVGARL